MQDLYPSHTPAEVKSVAKVELDLRLSGCLDPQTRQEIIDEEKTHAAEIMALITKRGCVPREYYFRGGELFDEFGYSLERIISSGIADAERKFGYGVSGAEKELRRRQIEQDNLRSSVMTLLIGQSCIEWSATDNTWTDKERSEHGYCGNTLARLTSRIDEEKFLQFNIILPHSDLRVINSCRKLIEPSAEELDSAEAILANPQQIEINLDDPFDTIAFIETEFSRALLATHVPEAVSYMLRGLIRRRKDAKEYVFAQDDIFEAMVESYVEIAKTRANSWREAVSIVRGGAWQLLIERYKGKDKNFGTIATSSSIGDAANRAAVAGAVFSACGGTIDMGGMQKITTASLIERSVTVMSLLSQENGVGRCSSCGRIDTLYGCGIFCQHCNEIWCDEYLRTGEQLEPQQVMLAMYMYYSRGPRPGY